MKFTEQLENLFVKEEEVPAEHRLPGEIHQKEYLTNGEMLQWDGPVHEVYSPICFHTTEGLKRKLIGTYPRRMADYERAGAH
jgi:hypothetical protein